MLRHHHHRRRTFPADVLFAPPNNDTAAIHALCCDTLERTDFFGFHTLFAILPPTSPTLYHALALGAALLDHIEPADRVELIGELLLFPSPFSTIRTSPPGGHHYLTHERSERLDYVLDYPGGAVQELLREVYLITPYLTTIPVLATLRRRGSDRASWAVVHQRANNNDEIVARTAHEGARTLASIVAAYLVMRRNTPSNTPIKHILYCGNELHNLLALVEYLYARWDLAPLMLNSNKHIYRPDVHAPPAWWCGIARLREHTPPLITRRDPRTSVWSGTNACPQMLVHFRNRCIREREPPVSKRRKLAEEEEEERGKEHLYLVPI